MSPACPNKFQNNVDKEEEQAAARGHERNLKRSLPSSEVCWVIQMTSQWDRFVSLEFCLSFSLKSLESEREQR